MTVFELYSIKRLFVISLGERFMKNKHISLILIFLLVVPFLSLAEGEEETQAVTEKTSEVLAGDLDWIAALSGEPYTGLKCEWFPDCKGVCEDIYRRSEARSSCNNEHPDTVKELGMIDEIFENPRVRNLESIGSSDFAIYVEIDLRTLQKHIGRFNALESRRVLVWIGENENIAGVFLKADSQFEEEEKEYNLLKALLHKLDTDVKEAFKRSLSGRDSLIEIIMREDNTKALQWVNGFFNKECANKDDTIIDKSCVFQQWSCKAVDLNELSENYWFDPIFMELIDPVSDILQDYTTDSPPKWWDEDTDAEGLTIEQINSICNANLVKK